MKRLICTYLLVGLYAASASAQSDTLQVQQAQPDTTAPAVTILPWIDHPGLFDRRVSSDSLIRWQIWPEWTTRKNRDPGVITYRLGGTGRTNAFLDDGHEPRHQRLYWEEVDMTDPVTGIVNWNLLPQHRLSGFYEDGTGIVHRSRFNVTQYYLNKPLTRLIFDESRFDYRNLEFLVSRNFTQKLNMEVGYWDRRGGDGYPNSKFDGRQIFAKAYYRIDNQNALKLRFLNNKYNLDMPFGYRIPQLGLFDFNRFNAVPRESLAEAALKTSTIALSYYRRPADTVAVEDNLQLSLFRRNASRDLSYGADTTGYNVDVTSAVAHKWVDLEPFRAEGRASYSLYNAGNTPRTGIGIDRWQLLTGEAKLVFEPIGLIALRGQGRYRRRSDGYDDREAGIGATLGYRGRVSLSADASTGTVMPTIQQRYWNSAEFSGRRGLDSEEITALKGQFLLKPFDTVTLGVKGQYKAIDRGIMVGADSTFVNAGNYRSLSATPFLEFNNRFMELSASGTLHRFEDLPVTPGGTARATQETIWLKGSAYWKGYLFDRAAYVKAGVAGMYAPRAYRASRYHPVLDFWQPSATESLIPPFHRLDVEISARVRMIMFLLRWENALDNLTQPGYFETARYPMPGRRFIFGFRALFRN